MTGQVVLAGREHSKRNQTVNTDLIRSHVSMPLGIARFAMKRQTDVTTVHDCSSHICGCVVQLYLPLV